MLRIAICDDEIDYTLHIQSKISSWNTSDIQPKIETFNNGDSLVHAHTKFPFDIIFLDVVMPIFNGIEVAREIRKTDSSVKIVFLTSSPEYAVDSYTVKATNYLLKPIDDTKLYQCLNELYEGLKSVQKMIYIKCSNSIHTIPLNDIEYIEAQNKHTLFVLKNNQILESIEIFYLHEDKLLLTDGFIKCHRSYIVNINHIDTYTAKEIRMRSGYRIPISRTYHSDFEKAYFSYTFRKAGEDL